MGKYHVTINYRTNSGCNSKMMDVEAESMEQAIKVASAKVKRQRGVIKIDGGQCWPYSDPRNSLLV